MDATRAAIKEWLTGEDAVCDSERAKDAAGKIGKAAATVYAEAIGKISCKDKKFGCGWHATSYGAWATSFAEAVAVAVSRAHEPHKNYKAICYSDIRAGAFSLTLAAGREQFFTCKLGKSLDAYEESLGNAIGSVFSDVFQTAVANSCPVSKQGLPPSTCKPGGGGNEQGDPCAGLKKIVPCTGIGKSICCDQFSHNVCFCGYFNCDNSPWTKSIEGGLTVFEDSLGNQCSCP